jgi:hypothetical protein
VTLDIFQKKSGEEPEEKEESSKIIAAKLEVAICLQY